MGEIADRLRAQAEQLLLESGRLLDQGAQLLEDSTRVAAMEDAPPCPPPAPPSPPAGIDPAYRCQTSHLFQPISMKEIAPRLPGLAPYKLEVSGPTAEFVDAQAGWKWATRGGDAGPALSTVSANAYPKGASGWYTMDALPAVLSAIAENRPWAFKIASNTARTMAGRDSSNPPRLTLTMDGEAVSVPCWVTCASGATSPAQCVPEHAMGCFVEFERQDVNPEDIDSAAIEFYVTRHDGMYSQAAFTLHLLTPDLTLPPVETGISSSYPMDVGIAEAPGVIFAHTYRDTEPEDMFLDRQEGRSPSDANIEAARNYSPNVFGIGDVDPSKFPYRGAGRFLNVGPESSIVRSDYSEDGFEPLAPGLGALRVHMPREARAAEGSLVYSQGTNSAKMELMMPIERMGYQHEISIRYAFRWGVPDGAPLELPLDAISCVWQKETNGVRNDPAWTSVGGKHGIVPTHDNKAGGFSGSSGGGYGWQNRLLWGRIPTGKPGPQSRGLYFGFHLYDQQSRRHPLGLNSAGSDLPWAAGKVGGILYAHRWYFIEHRLKLNSVNQPGILADGTPHVINGVPQLWTADGELTLFVDGMRVWHDDGLVFRTLPLVPPPSNYDPLTSAILYQIGDLGVRSALLNVYGGGTTPNTADMSMFYAGLVVSDGRHIGPMRLQ